MSGARVIRVPNHLGDLIMALPAIRMAGPSDLLVARGLASLLSMTNPAGTVIPFDRGFAGFARAARALRTAHYVHGLLLTPSYSSALLFVAGGVRSRRGLATGGRAALLTEPLPRSSFDGCHRAAAYAWLVTGRPVETALVPGIEVPAQQRERWRGLAGGDERRTIGIFPGSNASSRRWEPDRFRAVARHCAASGARVVVFGGRAETELTRSVAGDVALDMGGRTDLPLLAAGLASCDILLTNDSGPLHLAVAVGTPTVSLWGAGNPAATGPTGERHRILRRPDLPCVPCVKNACPRRGPGTFLPEAERECLRLIEVPDVLAALEAGP